MSTRANIQVETTEGKSKRIYTHWDGYPHNMGKTLLNHYNSQELAQSLIELGDMSSIDETIATCCFYARDKKEEINPAEECESFSLGDNEFTYQFTNGEWLINFNEDSPNSNKQWQKLTPELCEDGDY